MTDFFEYYDFQADQLALNKIERRKAMQLAKIEHWRELQTRRYNQSLCEQVETLTKTLFFPAIG